MKIAIQGHPTRGKEVIQILESLGNKNKYGLFGNATSCYYSTSTSNNIIDLLKHGITNNYRLYTLEEFEKEFPFKIGDKVIILNYDNKKGTISNITSYGPIFYYFIILESGNGIYRPATQLKIYEEMNTRNVTLTLDKAKEWYRKGGELKEIALQAFTKEELNPFPKTWEEYCKMYKVPTTIFGPCAPLKYIALWKLEQLRDCYRQGWKPDWTKGNPINSIYRSDRVIGTTALYSSHFLSFQSKEVAEEFLKNFEHLIRETGDLI